MAGGDGDGDADDLGPAREKQKETTKAAEKKTKNDDDEEEDEDKETIKRNGRDPQHFIKLNALRDTGAELTGVAVELLGDRIARGQSRYGSTIAK